MNNFKTERSPCDVCGSTSFTEFMVIKDFKLVTCLSCSFTFLNPKPSDDFLYSFYTSLKTDPYSVVAAYEFEQETLSGIVNLVLSFKKNGKVLDVGCADGQMIGEFSRNTDFECHGTDLFSGGPPDVPNVSFYDGYLKSQNFPDASFDVVVLRNTLEHLPCPNSELNEIRRILKKGGFLYIKVPNFTFEKFLFLFIRNPYRVFYPPAHISHFTKKTLSTILSNNGLQLEVWSMELPTRTASWKKNFIYRSVYYVFKLIRSLTFGVFAPTATLCGVAKKS